MGDRTICVHKVKLKHNNFESESNFSSNKWFVEDYKKSDLFVEDYLFIDGIEFN